MKTYVIFNSEHSGQPATRYVSGFSGSDSLLIFALSKSLQDAKSFNDALWAYMLVDGRYWGQAAQEVLSAKCRVLSQTHAQGIKIVKVRREYTSKQVLIEIVKRHKIKEVVVDPRITLYSSILALQELYIAVIPKADLFQKLRELKTKDEIQKIKKAQTIALKAYEELIPEIRPGVTEQYLAARLEFLMKQHGAEKTAFDTIVASGKNSVLPHARATTKTIGESDSVIVDFGCVYEGFCCDFTRTLLMPKVSGKLRSLYTIVEKAQKAALQKAKPGSLLKDIDKSARDVIVKEGYGEHFTHSTGHGVGMSVHELPHVSALSDEKLQKGHVITIEPGIYVPRLGGVRLEEMVIA